MNQDKVTSGYADDLEESVFWTGKTLGEHWPAPRVFVTVGLTLILPETTESVFQG